MTSQEKFWINIQAIILALVIGALIMYGAYVFVSRTELKATEVSQVEVQKYMEPHSNPLHRITMVPKTPVNDSWTKQDKKIKPIDGSLEIPRSLLGDDVDA